MSATWSLAPLRPRARQVCICFWTVCMRTPAQYVCMYVCMYVRMYVCTYVRMYVRHPGNREYFAIHLRPKHDAPTYFSMFKPSSLRSLSFFSLFESCLPLPCPVCSLWISRVFYTAGADVNTRVRSRGCRAPQTCRDRVRQDRVRRRRNLAANGKKLLRNLPAPSRVFSLNYHVRRVPSKSYGYWGISKFHPRAPRWVRMIEILGKGDEYLGLF